LRLENHSYSSPQPTSRGRAAKDCLSFGGTSAASILVALKAADSASQFSIRPQRRDTPPKNTAQPSTASGTSSSHVRDNWALAPRIEGPRIRLLREQMLNNKLQYVRHNDAQLADERHFQVRVFHPRGRYVEGRIANSDTLFWADKDIVFTAVRFQRWDRAAAEVPFYSEMDWLSHEEIRLMGSLMLCEKEGEPTLAMYPIQYYSPHLKDGEVNLVDEASQRELRFLVTRELDDPRQYLISSFIRRATDACRIERYTLLTSQQLDLPRQAELWQAIDVKDHLLMRGLFTLIKADMLSTHHEFTEEAIQCCFIALEATYRMVLRTLKQRGIANPTSKQAAEWVFDNFDWILGPDARLDRYFAEFYDQRVTTFHPESRFGVFPYALVMHDDLYHLRRAIRSILGFLVSGRHDSEFAKVLAASPRGPEES
jgi:hypothetical protein